MQTIVSQEYRSLGDMVMLKKIVLPKPRDDWRLVAKPMIGEIKGIPSIRGKTIATNGVLVIIESIIGTTWNAHLAFFVPDEDEETDLFEEGKTVKPTKHERMFEEFV